MDSGNIMIDIEAKCSTHKRYGAFEYLTYPESTARHTSIEAFLHGKLNLSKTTLNN